MVSKTSKKWKAATVKQRLGPIGLTQYRAISGPGNLWTGQSLDRAVSLSGSHVERGASFNSTPPTHRPHLSRSLTPHLSRALVPCTHCPVPLVLWADSVLPASTRGVSTTRPLSCSHLAVTACRRCHTVTACSR